MNDFNEWTKHFFIKTCHTLFSKGLIFLWCVRDGWRDYIPREEFFPFLLPGERGCQRLHPFGSRDTSDRLRVPRSTAILCLCLNLTAWFSSRGLLPVTHLLYQSALIALPCLLITTWRLVKAHRVTRNEQKRLHIVHCFTLVGLSIRRLYNLPKDVTQNLQKTDIRVMTFTSLWWQGFSSWYQWSVAYPSQIHSAQEW